MRADPELMNHLPYRYQRHSLDPEEIRYLVQNIRAGYAAPANLERGDFNWKLRITINLPDGGSARRSFTIRDRATAEWVEAYLAKARSGWHEHCRELRAKRSSRPR
jgi:hypothetical protein